MFIPPFLGVDLKIKKARVYPTPLHFLINILKVNNVIRVYTFSTPDMVNMRVCKVKPKTNLI